jgi:heme/copper-type cytochrome/quinol oxidase subunit 1
MRFIDRLGRAQRVVIVIALGLALRTVGSFLTSIGRRAVGWYAYSPLTTRLLPGGFALARPVRLLIWLVLIAIWAAVSIPVLRQVPAPDKVGAPPEAGAPPGA